MKIEVFAWNVATKFPYKHVSFPFSDEADIIAVGFQELSSQLTLQTYASQIPTGPFTIWLNFLKESIGLDYKLVAVQRMVNLGLVVFVRRNMTIDEIYQGYLGVGLCAIYGNKGVVGIALRMNDQLFGFVNCHLQAHEGISYFQKRNQDLKHVMDCLWLSCSKSKFVDLNMMNALFCFGDFNYRFHSKLIEKKRKEMSLSLNNWDVVERLYLSKNIKALLELDELAYAKKTRMISKFWNEGPIHFLPTYKHVMSEQEDKSLTLSRKRIAAYCDRILFWEQDCTIECLEYQRSCIWPAFSDHEPVQGLFFVNETQKKTNGHLSSQTWYFNRSKFLLRHNFWLITGMIVISAIFLHGNKFQS